MGGAKWVLTQHMHQPGPDMWIGSPGRQLGDASLVPDRNCVFFIEEYTNEVYTDETYTNVP